MDTFQINFFAAGINHRTTKIDIRERVAQSLNTLDFSGCVLLSTCNRIELYSESSEKIDYFVKHLLNFVRDDMIYRYTGISALRHLIRVASGLDSLVLGENEIMNQVRTAYRNSFNTLSSEIKFMFESALQVSKKVRSSVILSGPRSIPEAIIKVGYRIFGNMKKVILVIGAGEIIEVFLENIADRKPLKVFITNRTYENALKLKSIFSHIAITVLRFEEFKNYIPSCDIIVSGISGGVVLTESDFAEYKKPLFVADMGIPRNVSAGVNKLDGVYLFNIDDLKEIVDYSSSKVSRELLNAERIIESALNGFKT